MLSAIRHLAHAPDQLVVVSCFLIGSTLLLLGA